MPKTFQLQISDAEKNRLAQRIEQDFLLAKASHLRWSERCARWMQMWEKRVDPAKAGDEDKPNHEVPLIQWQCFNKLARDVQALLGEDAEITAKATGPSDVANVTKIGRYMTSRVFDQMKLINPLCIFEFRRVLNGWAAAYRPWYKDEYTTLKGGKPTRVCDYEGPGFFPLEPDDLIVPAERGVTSIQEFSFTIHRFPVSVDDLVRGDGTLYQGTSDPKFVKRLIDWAQQGPTNDYTLGAQDPVREERERSEGVDYDAYMYGRRILWVWAWYGKWRPLKKQKNDGEENDLDKRELYEADWVVKFIPGMKEIIGVQDLLQLYPKMKNRRPFVESTLLKDGTYRPKGFGALLEDIEDDLTDNSRLFQAAGELSVWPIIFFKPGGGMKPGVIQLEPGKAYPTEDPSSINVVKLTPNLEFTTARQQDLIAVAERVTGITDQSLGRSIDRPNAPRTASGQLALIEEGNVRAYLDSTILREDMENIVGEFWQMDCDLVPKTQPGLFFRVTEEQAGGLFDVKQGGAHMTPKEFAGKYDFSLKFATSVWARQAQKQELLGFTQLAMNNPIIVQNPLALWELTNRLARAFNITDFALMVPRPPIPDRPKTPDEEWTEMLEGEIVHVNPADNDQQHIAEHTQQLEEERREKDRDEQAIHFNVAHIMEHQRQMRAKQMMAALTTQLIQQTAIAGHPANGIDPAILQRLEMAHQMAQGQPPGVGPAASPGSGRMPAPTATPGDVPPPPAAVGAQNVPQAQDGQL